MHRLSEQVLAQHRAQSCPSVTTSSERRGTRALQLHVATATVDVVHFTQQQRPPVPKAWREPAELVAGIGLRHWRHPFGCGVTGEDGDSFRGSQRLGVEAQLRRQRLVEHHQPWCRHWCRLPRLVQTPQLHEVRAVHRQQRLGSDAH